MRSMWLLSIPLALLAACGPDTKPGLKPAAAEPSDPVARLKVEGEQLFRVRCSVCHQFTGQGIPGAVPPLNGSPWLLDEQSAERCTKILLYGLSGRIEVKGQTFDAQMPNFRLTDREIAAALTYVRSAWEHAAPPVDEAFVARIRAKHGDRGPWTPYEIMAQHPVQAH